jgi:hypothetical protein
LAGRVADQSVLDEIVVANPASAAVCRKVLRDVMISDLRFKVLKLRTSNGISKTTPSNPPNKLFCYR